MAQLLAVLEEPVVVLVDVVVEELVELLLLAGFASVELVEPGLVEAELSLELFAPPLLL